MSAKKKASKKTSSKKASKKRNHLLAAPLAIIVAALCVILIAVTRPSAADPMTFADAQAQAERSDKLASCLALRSQEVPGRTRQEITRVVSAKLTDVPAGLAYAVFFASYDNQNAAGTIAYDGIGNTFNFEVKQAQGYWRLTGFEPCEARS